MRAQAAHQPSWTAGPPPVDTPSAAATGLAGAPVMSSWSTIGVRYGAHRNSALRNGCARVQQERQLPAEATCCCGFAARHARTGVKGLSSWRAARLQAGGRGREGHAAGASLLCACCCVRLILLPGQLPPARKPILAK
jgi:hypothetical protein